MQGLSSALESIHNLHLNPTDRNVEISRIGYHHDLRPRNILVTPNTFLLADFGLSRLKIAEMNSRTTWRENMGDYIAPECMDQDFKPQEVGRSIDIWAFGGIIFDVAWYREQGSNGVKSARSARQGPGDRNKWDNQCFFLDNEVKRNVILSSDELRDCAKDTTTASLLKLAFSMLQIAPQQRPLAATVRRGFEFLTVKSLFHIARTTLQNYANRRQDEDRDDQVPSLTKFWLNLRRLDAWASVLEIHSDDCIPKDFDKAVNSTEGTYRSTQNVLSKIEDTFNDHNFSTYQAFRTGPSLPSMEPEDYSIRATYYEERHELLQQLVEKLWAPLPFPYRKRIDHVWQQFCIETNDIDALKEKEAAVKATNNVQYMEIGAVSSMKALRLAFYDQIRHDGDTGLLLPEADFEADTSFNVRSIHQIGWYKSSQGPKTDSKTTAVQVLIERVHCPPDMANESAEERMLRIGALAELLHKEPKPQGFRVLECLGFIDSEADAGFKFLYRFPNSVGGVRLVPTSLEDLLKGGTYKPALEEKLNVAKTLVSSIHQLHTADWLHRSINPTNILFFKEDSERAQVGFQEPFLVNFSHSRPSGEVWTTDGPAPDQDYQHPDYLSDDYPPPRFEKKFDYYSIGVVLLEVGLWRPLVSELRGEGGTPADFRWSLIEKWLPKLRRCMGRRYRNAVRECLKGDHFGETVTAQGLSEFFVNVVEPLFEIRL